jgi:hypothetical protein
MKMIELISSKINEKWNKNSNINKYLESNFPGVWKTKEGNLNVWRFTVNDVYHIKVYRHLYSIHIDVDGYYYHMSKNIVYENLHILKDEIDTMVSQIEEKIKRYSEQHRLEMERLVSMENRLKEEISQEYLEDLFIEVKDLPTASFKITLMSSQYSTNPCYYISFEILESDDPSEYFDLHEIIGRSIKRIKSTFHVQVTWLKDSLEIVITPLDDF